MRRHLHQSNQTPPWLGLGSTIVGHAGGSALAYAMRRTGYAGGLAGGLELFAEALLGQRPTVRQR